MNDPRFRRNLRRLADYGWSFDLQVFAPQMADAARLAADNPDITFVLQHCRHAGGPLADGRAAWREGMRRLADQPNVVNKLSGLGTFIHRNDAAHVADIVGETAALFGAGPLPLRQQLPDREALDQLRRPRRHALRQAIGTLPADDQAAMLAGTASRVYRV